MARITIRLPDTLYIQLVRAAKSRNRTHPEFSALVREALETYLGVQETLRPTTKQPTRRPVRQPKKE